MRKMINTLILPENLVGQLDNPDWLIIDCRFSLDDTARGRRDYRQAHIPGAIYAHLDDDLSAPVISGKTGRHPLPSVEALTKLFSRWGIDEFVQVVAYDDGPGAIASRLWWMLRWLGHDSVAVLDGGWQAWRKADLPVTNKITGRKPRKFSANPRNEWLATAKDIEQFRSDPNHCLIDARVGERFRGEIEPIDPVAGHIPGAINAPYAENLGANGRFLPPEMLREKFSALLDENDPAQSIHYCGSGVTACHNLLAMKYAGLGDGKLYAGSWSEWITDSLREIESIKK